MTTPRDDDHQDPGTATSEEPVPTIETDSTELALDPDADDPASDAIEHKGEIEDSTHRSPGDPEDQASVD